jgi:hypothetical protein
MGKDKIIANFFLDEYNKLPHNKSYGNLQQYVDLIKEQSFNPKGGLSDTFLQAAKDCERVYHNMGRGFSSSEDEEYNTPMIEIKNLIKELLSWTTKDGKCFREHPDYEKTFREGWRPIEVVNGWRQ